MDIKEIDFKDIIKKHYNILIHDIHGDVIESLRSGDFITESEFQELIDVKDRIEKNKKCLNYVLSKSYDKSKHLKFINILEKDYWWLANRLRLTITKNLSIPLEDIDREMDVKSILSSGSVPNSYLLKQKVDRNDLDLKFAQTELIQEGAEFVILLETLRQELLDLKKGSFIVLHGMVGCGKSCLAAEALNSSKVLKAFENHVFWIKSVEDVTHLQIQLFHHFCFVLKRNDERKTDTTEATAQLKMLLNDCNLTESLFIIDHIKENDSSRCIECIAKLNCKTLIITEVSNMISKNIVGVKHIKVDDCLSEEGWLSLLAKVANINVQDLPKEAKKMYKCVKGYPMALFFIADDFSYFKEDIRNVKCWESYINTFRQKSIEKRGRGKFSEMFAAVEMRFVNLNSDLQEYYKHFVIFKKDVFVTSQVLEMLWNSSQSYIKHIMKIFVDNSLAYAEYNDHNKSYIYGIHNILSLYLKNKFDDNVKKDLHKKLVDRYMQSCNWEFWKLPNDRYIYLYLGYHLKEAGYLDKFPKIFLDLRFLDSKIKAAGSHDMICDLKNYRRYISNIKGDYNYRKLTDIIKFINTSGPVIQQSQDIDIIQLGLQQDRSSLVHKAAMELARRNHSVDNKIAYIKFLEPLMTNNHKFFALSSGETFACFANTEYDFLVASSFGLIKLRSAELQNSIKMIYKGHNKDRYNIIRFLSYSRGRAFFLSVSSNSEKRIHEVVVWQTAGTSAHQSFTTNGGSDGERTPSPRLHGDNAPSWPIAGPPEEPFKISFTHKDEIHCAQFSPNYKFIVSCSNDKDMQIHPFLECDKVVSKLSVSLTSIPVCCTYSNDSTHIFVGLKKRQILIYNLNGKSVAKYKVDHSIMAIYPTSGVKNVFTGGHGCHDIIVVMHKLVQVIRYQPSNSFEILLSWDWEANCDKENYQYRFCFNKDASFIAISVSSHNICVYDLGTGKIIRKYETNSEVIAVDTIQDSDENSLLLASCLDGSVYVWRILLTSVNSNFSCLPFWKNNKPVIAFPINNTCQVMWGRDIINTLQIELNDVAVSCNILNDTNVVVGTRNGYVWLYDLKNSLNRKCVLQFDPVDCNLVSKRLSTSNCEVVFVRVHEVLDKLLIFAIDSNNILKVSYNENVQQYNATSKIIGCYYFAEVRFKYLQPKAHQILTIEKNCTIKVWNIQNWTQIIIADIKDYTLSNRIAEGAVIHTCDVCTDPNYSPMVALISKNNLVWITDLSDKKVENNDDKLCSIKPTSEPTCISFTPDAKHLAVGSVNGSVKIWKCNSVDETPLHSIELGDSPIKSISIGNDLMFGALGSNRVYLCFPQTPVKIAKTQLAATNIFKGVNSNIFVVNDTESTIHEVIFDPLQDDDDINT